MVLETAEKKIRSLQTIAREFAERDIYNIDKTRLFWKIMLSQGLSLQSLPGIKKEKAWITLAFCVNTSGSDRLPVWIIGKAKTPRALQNINILTWGIE